MSVASTIPCDTHKGVKRLEAKGFQPEPAGAIVEEVATHSTEVLATKAEIEVFKADVRAEIKGVRAEIADVGLAPVSLQVAVAGFLLSANLP